MDKLSETIKESPNDAASFINHVFNFDDANKAEMFNMFQYGLIAIIPILIILKAVKHVIPEEDDSKGSLEILMESIGQIILILGLIWFSDKIIRYVPTYSGSEYHKFYPSNFLLPFILILATMQTKFGAKLNILLERVLELWNGTTTSGSETSNIKVKQPIVNNHQPSQADHINTASILPNDRSLTTMPQQQQQEQQQQQGDVNFNNMYVDTQTSLENTNIPMMEPMAASDMGGGGFSSW
jgi:hypothetical protein|tara:strand:+ start:830 stop:1549 length:720 start_codon:yes stop_codon:yes gene_type:complete